MHFWHHNARNYGYINGYPKCWIQNTFGGLAHINCIVNMSGRSRLGQENIQYLIVHVILSVSEIRKEIIPNIYTAEPVT